MFKNNLTFGYVLFVGVPLLILIGTLRAGAGLSAPPAVAGDWTIESTANKCGRPLADASQPALSIYQTGSNLLIAFNDPWKTTLAGKLEDGGVTAVAVTEGGRALRLEAALSGNRAIVLCRAGCRSTGRMHALRFRSAQSNRESEGANDRPVQTHFCKSEYSCSR